MTPPAASPPRPDVPGRSTHGRGVAVVLLLIALVAQVLFLLGGLIGLSLSGATGLGFGVFLFVAIGAGWVLLWLVAAIVRDRVPPNRASFAVVVPIVDVLIVMLVATGSAFSGSCSERELATLDEIAQYPGTSPAFGYEPGSGSCAASLEMEASPDDVLQHYRTELERDDWTVSITTVPSESAGEPVTTKELTASRGGDTFTIALESSSGHTSAAIRIDAD
jgi:hypothetical protein